jgi:hypothetical protein
MVVSIKVREPIYVEDKSWELIYILHIFHSKAILNQAYIYANIAFLWHLQTLPSKRNSTSPMV